MAGQRVTAHVEESNERDVKQYKKSVVKEEEMKRKCVNNCQEPVISTAQPCVNGQLIGK